MKALFITGGSRAAVFDQACLALAARNAGHEVLMAGPDTVTEAISRVGLPPVSISPLKKQQFTADGAEDAGQGASAKPPVMPEDPDEQMRVVGHWYGQLTLESLPRMVELAQAWGPDLVVGPSLFYSAALLGHQIKVPTVRQPWGWVDTREYDAGAAGPLRPLLDELGLPAVPEPDLAIEVFPPSLMPSGMPPVQMLRWMPANMYRPVEPWMYTRGSRPRVILTSGSRLSSEGTPHTMALDALLDLAVRIAELDTELVLAVPEEPAAELRGPLERYGARVGWMPLDLVAPTSDLIIHHGGTGTNMNAMRCGLPQLVVPELPDAGEMRTLYDFGAAVELPRGEQSTENIVATCREMLADPVYRQRARALERELATLPSPAEVVGVLERLVAA